MTACPSDIDLAQLVDRALDEPARAAIEVHLDGCRACAELVSELAWIVAPPRAAPPGYRLLRALDAAGDRWLAIDPGGARVAIRFTVAGDPGALAAAARRVRPHPHVLAVRDAGTLGRAVFVVHELPCAPNARAWREATARSADELLALWRGAAAGVAAIHACGAVVGDLRPEHVLVVDGRAAIAAVACAVRPTLASAPYTAPEVLHGGPATPRSDQFALCVAIWEALAGRRPFAGPTIGALAVVMASPPVPAGKPRRAFAALARGLAADPARRWPSIAALADALG